MREVSAVRRACAILDFLAQTAEPPSVAAIGQALSIPRNTTYELVHTLKAYQFVEIADNGRVKLGFRVFELGGAYAQSLDLIREAREVTRQVVGRCNETCHVARLEGIEVVYLVKEEGTQLVRILSAVGRRVPAHATGVGKALLAYLPREELLRRLNGVQLRRMTPNTVTDVATLLKELDQVAARGYATDNEESTPDIRCVGSPVRDDRGQVVAAISIAVPARRMGGTRQRDLAALVVDAATSLSRRLGCPSHYLQSA
jgi:IclR family KDG regulon transcriptional repressor